MTENKDKRGILCPKCGCHHFFVIYTRATEGGTRRRRECRHCGHKITTYESTRSLANESP